MDELVKRLREEASEWCSNCCYRCGDNVCGAPDDRKKDCDIASKLQAADAIEELQKRVPKRPHGRLIDANALIEDLKYDVELDAVALDSMEIVGDERRKIQDDKDFKQNCTFWIEDAPAVLEAEEGE